MQQETPTNSLVHQTGAGQLDMHVIDSLNIWAPGLNGEVFHTTDGGIHWNEQLIAGSHPLYCISFKDSRFGWVGASDGFTAYTLDGGETWIPQPVSQFRAFQDIAVLGRETACIVGWGSVFLHYNGSVKPTILEVTDTIAHTKESYVSTIRSLGRPSPKYTLLQGPDNMKMDAPSGLLRWQAPGVKDTGAYHITVGAENPGGMDELSFTLHLKYVNHPPQISVFPYDPTIKTFVHTTIIFRAYAFDIDGDTLSTKWLVNQISYTDSVDSSGVHYFMFTPDSAGNYTLSFLTSDKEFRREFTWTVNVLGTVGNIENKAKLKFELAQNYPNPFNPSTTIPFSIPSKAFVSLKVFDALGREVSKLVSEELSAGTYARQWSAVGLASGLYFYRLQVRSLDPAEGGTGSFVDTKKLLLVR